MSDVNLRFVVDAQNNTQATFDAVTKQMAAIGEQMQKLAKDFQSLGKAQQQPQPKPPETPEPPSSDHYSKYKEALSHVSQISGATSMSFQDLTANAGQLIGTIAGASGPFIALAAGAALVSSKLGEMKEYIVSSIEAYSQFSVASQKLELVWANSGRNMPFAELEKQAKQAVAGTIYSYGEMQKAARAFVLRPQITDEQMGRTMKVTTDLAAIKDLDLGTAARVISQASTGMYTGLSRIAGIKLSPATMQLKDFGKALDEIESKLQGAAAIDAGSWEGQFKRIANSDAAVKKQFGEKFELALLPALRLLRQETEAYNKKLGEVAQGEGMSSFSGFLKNISVGAVSVYTKLMMAGVGAKGVLVDMWPAVIAASGPALAVFGPLLALLDKIGKSPLANNKALEAHTAKIKRTPEEKAAAETNWEEEMLKAKAYYKGVENIQSTALAAEKAEIELNSTSKIQAEQKIQAATTASAKARVATASEEYSQVRAMREAEFAKKSSELKAQFGGQEDEMAKQLVELRKKYTADQIQDEERLTSVIKSEVDKQYAAIAENANKRRALTEQMVDVERKAFEDLTKIQMNYFNPEARNKMKMEDIEAKAKEAEALKATNPEAAAKLAKEAQSAAAGMAKDWEAARLNALKNSEAMVDGWRKIALSGTDETAKWLGLYQQINIEVDRAHQLANQGYTKEAQEKIKQVSGMLESFVSSAPEGMKDQARYAMSKLQGQLAVEVRGLDSKLLADAASDNKKASEIVGRMANVQKDVLKDQISQLDKNTNAIISNVEAMEKLTGALQSFKTPEGGIGGGPGGAIGVITDAARGAIDWISGAAAQQIANIPQQVGQMIGEAVSSSIKTEMDRITPKMLEEGGPLEAYKGAKGKDFKPGEVVYYDPEAAKEYNSIVEEMHRIFPWRSKEELGWIDTRGAAAGTERGAINQLTEQQTAVLRDQYRPASEVIPDLKAKMDEWTNINQELAQAVRDQAKKPIDIHVTVNTKTGQTTTDVTR